MPRTDVYVSIARDEDNPKLWRARVRLVNPDKPTADIRYTLDEAHKSREKAMSRAALYVSTAGMAKLIPGMKMSYFQDIADDDRSRWRKLCDALGSMI